MAGGGPKGVIELYDLRKLAKNASALKTIDHHKKSINAAYFSLDGNFLLSVSQDDTVKVVADYLTDAMETGTLRHDNFTGRWLSTFRPTFDPKSPSSFLLGSMSRPREMNVFALERTEKKSKNVEIRTAATLRGDALSSVCSRNAFHPTLDMIAGGNSSGRIHLFR